MQSSENGMSPPGSIWLDKNIKHSNTPNLTKLLETDAHSLFFKDT